MFKYLVIIVLAIVLAGCNGLFTETPLDRVMNLTRGVNDSVKDKCEQLADSATEQGRPVNLSELSTFLPPELALLGRLLNIVPKGSTSLVQ